LAEVPGSRGKSGAVLVPETVLPPPAPFLIPQPCPPYPCAGPSFTTIIRRPCATRHPHAIKLRVDPIPIPIHRQKYNKSYVLKASSCTSSLVGGHQSGLAMPIIPIHADRRAPRQLLVRANFHHTMSYRRLRPPIMPLRRRHHHNTTAVSCAVQPIPTPCRRPYTHARPNGLVATLSMGRGGGGW